jgi:hypothetical protein
MGCEAKKEKPAAPEGGAPAGGEPAPAGGEQK